MVNSRHSRETVKIVSSNYTLNPKTDYSVILDSQSTAFTLTIPPAVDSSSKFVLEMRNIDNLITILPTGWDTISWDINNVLGKSYTIQSDSVGTWMVIWVEAVAWDIEWTFAAWNDTRFDDIGIWSLVEVVQNITNGNSATLINVPMRAITWLAAIIPNPGSEIAAVWTVDPTNVSTLDANLINGNLTDLCYNNVSTWSANKPLPWIDLGSSMAIGQIDLYRWSATYLSNDFNIQGSDDSTTWVDVATNLSSTAVWLQEIPVSGTYRYWRLFNVSGTNPTYVVLSEMKAFTVWVGSTTISVTNSPDVSLVKSWTDSIITNNLGQDLDFIINYLT